MCSLLLHCALVLDLLRAATPLSGAASAQPEAAWVDLSMSGPAAGDSMAPGSAAGATPAVAERSAPAAASPPTAAGPRPEPARRPIVP
ncbi:MAG TPA: ABC transporter permease, partial [Methylomirabilota bacterium]|nr:ABC transporter permease [Methylomirabilota bacterium]